MNCLTTALSLVGTFAQYQVQPLPYTFFQANSSGTVLLYKFDSPTQRYLFWRYQNGGLTPLDITQPKDVVRKLDASGRLFGDSGTYQGLRWDGLMSSAFKYNRRVLYGAT